ncbi:MAG: hypothetical protein ACT4RN_12715 [Pseudonocardia sp.]
MSVGDRGVPLRGGPPAGGGRTSPAERAHLLDGPPGWRPERLDSEPGSVFPPYGRCRDRWVPDTHDDRAAALAHALDGVELGAHDARVLAWLAGWDNPTVATVCSLIRRARLAGR